VSRVKCYPNLKLKSSKIYEPGPGTVKMCRAPRQTRRLYPPQIAPQFGGISARPSTAARPKGGRGAERLRYVMCSCPTPLFILVANGFYLQSKIHLIIKVTTQVFFFQQEKNFAINLRGYILHISS